MRTIVSLSATCIAVTLIFWAIDPPGNLPTIRPDSTLQSMPVSESIQYENFPQLKQLEQAHQPASTYWQADPRAEARRIADILQAARQARAVLIATFGPAVRENPAFWQLFKPLNDRMPALSSAQQIALFELEQEALVRAASNGSNPQFHEHLANVQAQLGSEVAQEYALRASPVAEELRRVGAQLTKDDFRDAFAALSQLSEAISRQQFVATRRALRDRLGSQVFAKLWSGRDPHYPEIQKVSRQFELDDDTALAAYALLLDNEDAMIASITDSGHETHSDAIKMQYESGRRRLQELVGERPAAALLQAAAGLLK